MWWGSRQVVDQAVADLGATQAEFYCGSLVCAGGGGAGSSGGVGTAATYGADEFEGISAVAQGLHETTCACVVGGHETRDSDFAS